MARVLVYLMEAPRTRPLGLEAPKYTPSLLEVEVDLCVAVEDFDYMPELHWTLGYPFALALMVTVSVSLYLAFKRRGWL